MVDDVVQVPNPGAHRRPMSYVYNVDYGNLSADDIRAFIEKRESCKQYVSYKCSNATLFGGSQSSLSSWTSVSDTPKEYWAGCSFTDKTCQCDQGKSMPEEDAGYLTKKKDLPVKSLQIGGLSSGSNVSIMIGSIVCYGGWFKCLGCINIHFFKYISINFIHLRNLCHSLYTGFFKSTILTMFKTF